MLDRDVALAKMAIVRRCVGRVRSVAGLAGEHLDHPVAQDATVLNLQRAIQAAIGLGAHAVAAQDLGLPATLKETFVLLRDGGLITADLCGRLGAMVGFRNIAVHGYQEIDLDILRSVVRDHLGDLEAFLATMAPLVPPRAE